MRLRTIVGRLAALAGVGAVVVIGAAIALSLAYRHAIQNFEPVQPATAGDTTRSQWANPNKETLPFARG